MEVIMKDNFEMVRDMVKELSIIMNQNKLKEYGLRISYLVMDT